ncbi:DsbA family protein [Paraflavitalea pollutisoli]|uniref:DsbA family protein n=1 Tax=Paraflavitalea pollutisoli TaxID=3034143 RepID=UPI0023ECC83D|nr:thioredoxin domain-containing protein [Paraflavitalea sp. H1-2-19X]
MSKLNPPVHQGDHFEGAANAALTLVEYGDYQCPHCGAAFPIVKQIVTHWGDKLKFVFRNFPLSNAHPMAFPAAVAAEAAARQNKYWEMHDAIFEHQKTLSPELLFLLAKNVGLDLEQFRNDIQDQDLEDMVNEDFESGIRSGVNGTPSFFINGDKYNGSYDYDSLQAALHAKVQHTHTH